MAVLLLAEVNDGALSMDATAKAVSAAKALGDVTVLCAGGSAAAAGAEAATIEGVAKVLVAEDAGLSHRLAEATADLIVSLAGDYEHIVAPATTDAKNVMPRVAALLDVMVLSDVSGVVDASTFERPIYAGNAIQTVKSSDAKKVVTVRGTAFDAAADGGSASVEAVDAGAREEPVEVGDDLGEGGGDGGGDIVATGSPEAVSKIAASHTGRFLKKMLEG